jgi:predicted phosphodiesterase
MKVALASDLHLEFGDLDLNNDENADVLVLAGDIFIATELMGLNSPIENFASTRAKKYYDFIVRCCERFPEVIMVSGNHEHYHGDFYTTHDTIRKSFSDLENFNYLDKDFLIIKGTVFFGGTLWTDMNKEDPDTLYTIRGVMNDYRQIKNTSPLAGGKFLPEDSVEDHFAFRRALDSVLENYPTHQVVVVGHHAPSKLSTHPRYKDEFHMNGAYSSDMTDFIVARNQIKLWVHGHTHDAYDYIVGNTRVACNPRGYIGYEAEADNFKLVTFDV